MKDTVKAIKPATELSPERAAGVARLRAITEQYIRGEIGGVCLIMADNNGAIAEDDIVGEINVTDLYMHCGVLQLQLAMGELAEDE